MYWVSIIIFGLDSGGDFIEASELEPPIFAEDGSVVGLSHCFHDLFLSASLEGGSVVVHGITEVSFVMCGSSEEFVFGLSSVMFGGLLAEEVVPVEKVVAPDGNSQHPEWPDSPEPPLVSFHNEVGVVKHDYLFIYSSLININFNSSQLLSIYIHLSQSKKYP